MKTSELKKILKDSLKKKPRSTVTKGLDLSSQVHKSKKDYKRKEKVKSNKIFLDDF
jgi:hypothetical protein